MPISIGFNSVLTHRRLLGLAVMLLAGCGTVDLSGPEYQTPEAATKPNWSELDNRVVTTSEVIQPQWWKGFGDPLLNGLIDEAISQGMDLKIATLALERESLDVRHAQGDRRPETSLNPRQTYGVRQESDGSNSQTVDNTEVLGLQVSWEIDLWGKLKKQQEVQEAEYRMSEMDWRGAYLSLVGKVASKYFLIRRLDEQIGNQQDSIQRGEQLLRIYEAQYEEGLVPRTRILSQEAEISRLKTTLYEQERTRRQTELELATLLGRPAGELEVVPGSLDTVDVIPVPDLLPADMLARRPDVLKAEYDVLRAHHALGVARLKRLPSLNLNLAATSGSSLVNSFIDAWQLTYTLDGSGMFSREVKREIETNEHTRRASVETYRRQVLMALEDVEVRLNNLSVRYRQMQELEDQAMFLTDVRNGQRDSFAEGLVSQLELFETERTLLDAQQSRLDAYQQILNETVELYKALGGGWRPDQTTQVSQLMDAN